MKYGYILSRVPRDPNEFSFDNDICYIQTYDKFSNPKNLVLIDSEDYNKVKNLKWCVMQDNIVMNNYVGLLSRFIMDVLDDDSVQVDHKNHNRLDNRKENLRVCTPGQNSRNTRKPSNNKSGYKGVSWDASRNKWMVKIGLNRKAIHLGRYTSKKEAVKAYNEAAIKYHGEFACLNKL